MSRLGRTRRSPATRALVRETRLSAAQLVQPLFVVDRAEDAGEIASLPGHSRLAGGEVESAAERLASSGVGGVLLFGIPAAKDALGSSASAADSAVARAVRAFRRAAPDLAVITDVCLCAYTDHGHCGVLGEHGAGARGAVHFDKVRFDDARTLSRYGAMAVAHAEAGADFVAPSGMMDGQVAAIRSALDEAGHRDVSILAYAVKYASAFYGPFRDAAGSAPAEGDRRGHQMDPANVREALREARQDEVEGADVIMVKPAHGYLDVIAAIRRRTTLPVAAYHVSGECAMIEAAAERGWLDRRSAVLETLTAIARAGADILITYFAEEVAGWLGTGGGRAP